MGQSQQDHPSLLSSVKQQYKELAETTLARAMGEGEGQAAAREGGSAPKSSVLC